ncbi:MAG: hypothetical protein ACRDT4_03400 [Micromonosporaceae bacterium]
MTLGSLLVRPWLPEVARVAAVAGLALFVVAGEFGVHGIMLPHRRAQVPSSVVSSGGQHGGLQFGYEMGTGMRTHMPSNLPYLPLVVTFLVASWQEALLVGTGFGLGRAWMALGRHYSGDLDWWDGQWRRHGRRLRWVLTILVSALLALGVPMLDGR